MTGGNNIIGQLIARLSEAATLGMFGPGWRVVTEQGDSEALPFMLVQPMPGVEGLEDDAAIVQVDCHAPVAPWGEMVSLNERVIAAAETADGLLLQTGVSEVHSRQHTVVYLRLARAA